MKLIKGKSYIFFGNFPDCNKVAEKLSEELGITAKAFMSKTDSTSVLEYCKEDNELKEKNSLNGKYLNKCKEIKELKEKLEVSKLETERWQNSFNDKSKDHEELLESYKTLHNKKMLKTHENVDKMIKEIKELKNQIEYYKKIYTKKWSLFK